MNWIDYRQLPLAAGGFSELFFDYLHDFNQVQQFYDCNFREDQSVEPILQARTFPDSHREILCTVLAEQNRTFGGHPKTGLNIDLLKKRTTFAVVTGQQVGLFGGPTYTIFKTITAIKLAESLKARYPQYDFVPVFWIEGEDHDFAEMNHTSILDAESKSFSIHYLPGGELPEKNMGAVGELTFDNTLESCFTALEANLQKTEFTAPLLNALRDSYKVGTTCNVAFASWMNHLFGEYGLVFLSVNDARLKKLLSPMFVREIEQSPTTSQLVVARSAELEQRYHAQVKAKSVNLFMFHKGGRYGIEPREHDFSLRGTRHFINKDELLSIAGNTPELLSPNVVLRPVAQDMLLPTAAYVAGPSEVAYQAQLTPVYHHFGIRQPVIYPRASASFVEERVHRAMEKYALDISAFFDNPEHVKAVVVEQIEEVKVDRIFQEAVTRVHDALNELRYGVKEIDSTLLATLDGVKSKFDINLGVLKEKSLGAQKRKNEVAMRQIERAASAILPGGTLQEREISILHYMNKYGPDLIRWLTAELDIAGFKHQILML